MSIKPNRDVMRAAIQMAELNKTPFGAALAMGDQPFATATHQTREWSDFTAHAEIKVIRRLSEQIRKNDLSGFVLYSICEPCESCMSEVVDSGIKTVVYGCRRTVVEIYMDQIDLRTDETDLKKSNGIDLHKNFMKEECEALLQKFF